MKILKNRTVRLQRFSNKELLISDEEFYGFLSRNKRRHGETAIERTMEHSYLIIDNFENLLDDKDYRYTVLGNLIYEPFEEVIKEYSLDKEKYDNRYKKSSLKRSFFFGKTWLNLLFSCTFLACMVKYQ